MSLKTIRKVPFIRAMLYRFAKWRVAEKIKEITPWLNPADNIIDIGCGNGVLCNELSSLGYKITPLDVMNSSFIDSVTPVIYDGIRTPFEDNTFSAGLLITVLHHTKSPEQLLTEALRIAGRLIIIEEIYSNHFEKWFTYIIDSIFNLEFFGHPHSNLTDSLWKEMFERHRLRLVDASYSKSLLFLKRVTYILESEKKQKQGTAT